MHSFIISTQLWFKGYSLAGRWWLGQFTWYVPAGHTDNRPTGSSLFSVWHHPWGRYLVVVRHAIPLKLRIFQVASLRWAILIIPPWVAIIPMGCRPLWSSSARLEQPSSTSSLWLLCLTSPSFCHPHHHRQNCTQHILPPCPSHFLPRP